MTLEPETAAAVEPTRLEHGNCEWCAHVVSARTTQAVDAAERDHEAYAHAITLEKAETAQ